MAAASTKRLLKERTNLARNPIPYVTFFDDENDGNNEDDDDDDLKMSEDSLESNNNNIRQWRLLLTLDPIHDDLDGCSIIGKAADSPYCCAPTTLTSTSPPSSSSSSSGKNITTTTTSSSRGTASLLAGVTRAASSRVSKKSTTTPTNNNNNMSSSSSSTTSSSSSSSAAYFAFRLDFPPNYPFKPPKITVVGPSYHPNIQNSTGELCDAVLTGEGWGPTLNVKSICARLRKFLCEPDVHHPLEAELGQLLDEKPGEYQAAAYKFAREHAWDRKRVEECLRRDCDGGRSR